MNGMNGDKAHDQLDHPEEIRDDTGKRKDGQATGHEHQGIRPGLDQDEAPTIAPEEEGGTPTTEHGPGGDLG
jgi:hypothetical protein